MASVGYSFEGRDSPLADDTELYMDDLLRSRNLLKEWDAFNGMGFIQPENLVHDANINSGKPFPSTTEFQTRFPNSAIETNDAKSAQSGLENKKLVASRKSTCNGVLENPVSAKRAKVTNLQSQVPVCIVHGCNKDLSSSKDYHKRHKVCDVHSKTAVVIVNGIQQRFCQQCSRFHKLAEFDEGKRSCRKRLTGHNERRRKPKWHNPFGSKIFGTDLSATSSIYYSKLLPHGFLDQQYYELTSYSKHIKLEDEASLSHPLRFRHSLPKSLHEMGKGYPSKNCLNSPLSVLELSAGSNPSCALSLLSAQSQSLYNNSADISFDHPRTFKDVINQTPTKSTPDNFILNNFSSSSGEVDQMVPEARSSRGVGTPENKVSQQLATREGANTVDLVQLSLHLQRVEQQKYSAPY